MKRASKITYWLVKIPLLKKNRESVREALSPELL